MGAFTLPGGPQRFGPLLVTMHVYLDDSESLRGDEYVCLAGFAARDSAWEEFAQKWARLLIRLNLPPTGDYRFLHVSDFLSGEGVYKESSREFPVRVEIVRHFIGLIRQYIDFGIGVGVDAKALREVTAGDKKRVSPLVFCFMRVLRNLIDHSGILSPGEIMSLVLDDSESSAMKLYGTLKTLKRLHPEVRNRVGAITFADDRFFQPLQAADLAACIGIRELKRPNDAWSDAFGSFGVMLRDADPDFGLLYLSELWNRDDLEKNADLIRAMALAEH
jgi:hypothetical protein